MMDRYAVESSMATSIGYDPVMLTLEIEFRSGEVWQYYNVPEGVYAEMLGGSIGRYFQDNIKNQYAEKRVG
jgi:KTSC domain